jgi:hypothetical protein
MDRRVDKTSWAVGGATLVGLGIGLLFVKTSVLAFLASILVGVGAGLLIAAILPGRER